jgi:RNA polymerase sigma-70 factor (ECF subfamily)
MDEDQQAIVDCQMGKSESYRFLVEKYKVRAFHAALLFTGNREDALDLSQEAFFRAFRSINSFERGKKFYTWLYQILKNLCINHLKRKKRKSPVLTDVEERSGPNLYFSADDRPDEIFEKHEMRDILWSALNKLKKDEKEIVILKEFNELSYKEIAEVLDIPMGSVMSRLYYARQRLGKIMEEMI